MQTRVTAILVARNGGTYLGRTIAAIAAGTRRPDALVYVDAASTDDSAALLAAGEPTQFVSAKSRTTFGGAVAQALRAAPAADGNDEWLWLLSQDSAPDPGALAALLGAVEIAPSVAVAGPKLMEWEHSDVIASFGESMTAYGRSVQLVDGELDQAQHDRQSDLLAVAASGMLVRRSVWVALGGFDPGLPSIDAALDFCVRVRLAGHRVIAVPAAKVATDGAPAFFPTSRPARARVARAAQLHRRITYAPPLGVLLHWLTLLPLAIARSVVHLGAKRPWAIPGEFAAALGTAFDAGIGIARRNLARTRSLGWAAIAPLRVQSGQARELAANRAAVATSGTAGEVVVARPGFFTAGGAWVVILLAAVNVVAFVPLLGAEALTGGGLVPLSTTVGALWSHVGFDADPFAWVLAVLGSLAFWSPSVGVVILWLVALPLAGLAAWFAAARFSTRSWPPAIAAVLWALAPSFLSSLGDGHIGAVVAHLLLPWLVLAVVSAARSWAASGAAAVLFAATLASAPSLGPALLLAWLAWAIANPRAIGRLLFAVVPLAVLFAPIVASRVSSGNVLALLADPGVPVVAGTTSGWQLALGSPDGGLNGWSIVAAGFGLPGTTAAVIVAAMLLPLAALALLSLFLPGSRRAIPAMSLALLGFVTAVVAAHLEVSHLGATPVAIWPAAGLSLYWLGLIGAAVIALESLGSAVVLPALLAVVGAVALAVPLVAAPIAGSIPVAQSTGRMLPAFVTAEAATKPTTGTLELIPQADGSLRAVLDRGAGTTLDERSTAANTATGASPGQKKLATLAGNLAAHSGLDFAAALQEANVGFIVLPDAEPGLATTARTRAADALDSNSTLTAVGKTASGYLWRYADLKPVAEKNEPLSVAAFAYLVALGLAFGLALLIAIPTGSRRRPVASNSDDENPADTFEEDESA